MPNSPFLRCLLLALFTGVTTVWAQVPAPEAVLGYKPGADFKLTRYDEQLAYFRKLAASSERIRLVNVGKTTRGQDWYVALISSADNLRNLDKYKELSRKLAHVRGLDDNAARALAREGKAIIHIDAGLHSTEVAPVEHSIQLAYDLVSGAENPEVKRITDSVILLLWFNINPDGQNMMVDWYRKNLGTPYEVAPLPELYQEYVGHDNNRDGYMNNMLESQVVTRTTLEWNPQVFYNQHQVAPFPARIWIPPFAEPVSNNVHPILFRWVNVFGTSMAAYLDDRGMPGAIHREQFDDWYPGFIDHVNSFRNTVSFITETALYNYATPHFYTVNDFPRDAQALKSNPMYSSPWKGGWWRLADAVRYNVAASMAVLTVAAQNKEQLLYNRYQAGRDTVQRFQQEPPYAYVVPREQRDLPAAVTLVEKLLVNGLEVHQTVKPFAANATTYPAGSWVVLMDQPYAALAKELFELQRYPDIRQTPNGPPDLPYDVAGWTLPAQMGVTAAAVAEPVSSQVRASLRRVDQAAVELTAVPNGPVFTAKRSANQTVRLVNAVLAEKGTVQVARKDGTPYFSGIGRDRLAALAKPLHLELSAAEAPAPDAVQTLKAPRVGLYRPYTASIDEGWTRWLFEQYQFAPVTLRNGDIQAGRLKERFDAIVLADGRGDTFLRGYRSGRVPERFAGGLEESGVEALRDFVREGGTLVTFNNASLFAIEQLSLPVKNVVAGLKNEEFFCSGSLLQTEAQSSHPVLAGMPPQPAVMFERSPAFEAKDGFRGTVLLSYPKDRNPLVSGFLLRGERIQGKAALLDVEYGQGHVILFGFRPQWRGQSHGTYKLIFNSLFLRPGMVESKSGEAKKSS